MTQKVPPTKLNIKKEVPIIGGANKEMQEIAEKVTRKLIGEFAQTLEQLIGTLNGNIDVLERRISVFDEMKTLLPSKIEVVVKQEK